MIQAEGLVKTFTRTEKKNKKTEFNAVDGISLEIREGEILGVLGPNGAGKTTLLRMLGKLMNPTQGTVLILNDDGEEITDDIEIKKRICLGTQSFISAYPDGSFSQCWGIFMI